VGVPLPAKKVAAQEMTRGSMKSTYTEDICATVWMDSQAVFMMSNFTGPTPTGNILSYSIKYSNKNIFFSHSFVAKAQCCGSKFYLFSGTCSRYSSAAKKYVDVPCPNSVLEYNKVMGGVDLVNETTKNYCIQVRLKKWYWSLISWFFNIMIVQAWHLYRHTWRLRHHLTRDHDQADSDAFNQSLQRMPNLARVQARKEQETLVKKRMAEEKKVEEIPLLEFVRQCVEQIILYHSQEKGAKLHESRLSEASRNMLRYDHSRPHFPISTETKGVCQNCKQRSFIRCKTCNVALHVQCFVPYHTAS
jgi:hypothetical protein